MKSLSLNWKNIFYYINREITKTEYRDEYVAGQWLTPQGATSPDEITVTIGNIPFLFMAFDGVNLEEKKSNSFEINHDVDIIGLNEGRVEIEWHVHCMPSDNTAGNVKWFLDYCYLPTFEKPLIQGSISTITTINANEQYKHIISSAILPIPEGNFDISDIILCNIRRNPSDVEDTYNSDILFIKTALHVPINSKGSSQKYSK